MTEEDLVVEISETAPMTSPACSRSSCAERWECFFATERERQRTIIWPSRNESSKKHPAALRETHRPAGTAIFIETLDLNRIRIRAGDTGRGRFQSQKPVVSPRSSMRRALADCIVKQSCRL